MQVWSLDMLCYWSLDESKHLERASSMALLSNRLARILEVLYGTEQGPI